MKSKSGSLEPHNPAEETPFYRLRLFVAGNEPNSVKARAVLSRLREKYLQDRCEILVVDVFENFQAAIDYQVVAVPALIVDYPLPQKTIVGSLSDEEKLLAGLGITRKEDLL